MEATQEKEVKDPVIDIKVRRVNDIANIIQAKQKDPAFVAQLHGSVKAAVHAGQSHVRMTFSRWQKAKDLAKK